MTIASKLLKQRQLQQLQRVNDVNSSIQQLLLNCGCSSSCISFIELTEDRQVNYYSSITLNECRASQPLGLGGVNINNTSTILKLCTSSRKDDKITEQYSVNPN